MKLSIKVKYYDSSLDQEFSFQGRGQTNKSLILSFKYADI